MPELLFPYEPPEAPAYVSPTAPMLYYIPVLPPTPIGAPTHHVRLAVQGQVSGKGIESLLYFRVSNTAGLSPVSLAADLAANWLLDRAGPWLAALPQVYTLAQLAVEVFDTAWKPLLDAPRIALASGAGAINIPLSGRAQTLNLSFALDFESRVGSTNPRLLKRTRIAFGPVGETAIDNSGNVLTNLWPNGVLASLMASLVDSIAGGSGNEYATERWSTLDSNGQRAAAQIVGASIKNRSSFRRSRNNG